MINIKSKDLVSICIPVFNGENTIRDTLLSAINQTYENIEIVVVDNCSEDNTVNIVQANMSGHIRLYQNSENLGMVGNWNKCLEYAKGEYITILCADDLLNRDCIEKKVNIMRENKDVVMVFSASEIINENGTSLMKRRVFNNNKIMEGKKISLRSYREKNLFGEPSNVLFRKSALNETGGFDASMYYSADWDMWLKIANTGKVGYISEVLMKYRVSKNNQTSKTKLQTYIKDDSRMMSNIHNNNYMSTKKVDDCIHRGMFIFRMFARIVYLKVKA